METMNEDFQNPNEQEENSPNFFENLTVMGYKDEIVEMFLSIPDLLDIRDDVPPEKALYDFLLSSISSGRLAKGDHIPTVKKTAAIAGLSLDAVRSVYEQLCQEGRLTMYKDINAHVC